MLTFQGVLCQHPATTLGSGLVVNRHQANCWLEAHKTTREQSLAFFWFYANAVFGNHPTALNQTLPHVRKLWILKSCQKFGVSFSTTRGSKTIFWCFTTTCQRNYLLNETSY